ncbi:MAG: SprB repeat-containing protein, partial [Flavobacteriales bacterium]|nr:SprB repeat-containing protein [Flavobacteriales bacterium]
MKRLLLGVAALFCSTLAYSQATGIVVETYAEDIGMVGTADLTGYTTYRVYAKFASDQDFLTAVYGDVDFPTRIRGGNNFFHSALGGLSNATYNPILFAGFPDLEFDSFVTIGMDAPANSNDGEAAINSVGDPGNNWIPAFEPGGGMTGNDIVIATQTGGSWFPLYPDANAYAGADSLVMIGQFTTDTTLYGVVSIASFVGGDQDSTALATFAFSSIADAVFGCTDSNATNFDPAANEDNGSCLFSCDYPATPLTITGTTANSVSCSGGTDGYAAVTVSGGQGSLNFSNGIVSNATGIFNGVIAGELTLTVTDNVGCSISTTVTVGSPDPLDVTANLSDPISCNGFSDAVLSGFSTGGTGGVMYSLDAPVDTGAGPYFEMGSDVLLFENIGVGLYTVYAIDANGCTDQTPGISIAQPQPFNVYAQAVVPTTCPDSEDGQVVMNFFGGSGNSTQYSLDGMTYSAVSTFDLAAGSYVFYGQDVNGCLDTSDVIDVTAPAEFVSQVDLTEPSCFGATDGSISVEVQGGTGPLSYNYDGTTSDVLMIDMAGAGNYAITVVDGNGCSYDASVDLGGPAEVVPAATVTNVLCSDSEDGVIAVSATGGTGMGYIYSIDGGGFGPNGTFDG